MAAAAAAITVDVDVTVILFVGNGFKDVSALVDGAHKIDEEVDAVTDKGLLLIETASCVL